VVKPRRTHTLTMKAWTRGEEQVLVLIEGVLVERELAILGVGLAVRAKNQGQRLERAVVLKRLLRPVAGGVEQNRAKLERGVVGNAKPPVRRDVAPSVGQVALYDGEQVLNLLRARWVGPQPAVIGPLRQAHLRCLSQRVSARPERR